MSLKWMYLCDIILSIIQHSTGKMLINPESAKFLKINLEMDWVDLWQLL